MTFTEAEMRVLGYFLFAAGALGLIRLAYMLGRDR